MIYEDKDLKGVIKARYMSDLDYNPTKIEPDDSYNKTIRFKHGDYNIPKTLEDLEKGDVVVSTAGCEKTVLEVLGQLYFLSSDNNPEKYCFASTVKELKDLGCTVKQNPQPQEETVNLFGKKYLKSELEQATKGIKEVE